ncbi:MAG: potassium-transporting ATPase subunit KdpC [Deltaproteobacteria bacterium]|nr:potassium-transporting ATPase subunit KdpC [Deltaproteobacteria bacterium]
MLQLKRSILVFAGLSIICGLIYPLIITAVSQTVFPRQSNAGIIQKGNIIIGSRLIGQQFTRTEYFHGRPSATDPSYDAGNSSGSNLAPSSAKLLEQVNARIEKARQDYGLPANMPVPADLVLASASGLDPHISVEAALLQAPRIAGERKIPQSEIEKIVLQNTENPLLGIWGMQRVNVLQLNIALDSKRI